VSLDLWVKAPLLGGRDLVAWLLKARGGRFERLERASGAAGVPVRVGRHLGEKWIDSAVEWRGASGAAAESSEMARR